MIRFQYSYSGAAAILAVIVVVGGVNLCSKRAQIAEITAQNAALEKHIAQSARPATPLRAAGRSPSETPAVVENPIDWQVVIKEINSSTKRKELERRLNGMSFADLLVEMEQAKKGGLQEHWVAMLFLDPLAAKDPGAALSLFCVDAPRSVQPALRRVLHQWAQQNFAESCAWLDKQIALGRLTATQLNGVNEMRVHFEDALLDSLIKSNPSMAEQRLNALTEAEALRVLQLLVRDLPQRLEKHEYVHFVNLPRKGLPENLQLALFSDAAVRTLSQGDTAFTGFLSDIKATPAERDACVAKAVATKIANKVGKGAVSIEAVDEVRQWAQTMNAGGIDMAIGKNIGQSVSGWGLTFHDAAELALHCQTVSQSDDALIAFLDSHDKKHHAEAQALVGRIRDRARLAELPDCLKK